MRVAIFIPTLYRHFNILSLVESIEATSPDNVQTHFMCPDNDIQTREILNELGQSYWTDAGDMRFSTRIQYMYENTSEEWFLTGADDLSFKPGWLTAAEPYMDDYSVISFQDECNQSLPGTNFLIKREYIEKQSGVIDVPNRVFHNGYFHNFVDNELVAVASRRGEFIQCPGVITHNHPMVGRASWDNIYEMAQERFHVDASIFNSRIPLWA